MNTFGDKQIDMTFFNKWRQNQAIIVETDMEKIVVQDAQEIVTDGIEKCTSDGEVNIDDACKYIKLKMDNQFGPYWHCIIGEGFSFEVTRMANATLFMYYAGKLSILLYK